jgi:sporulation protein YlmC with PRC-barrel domain
MQPENATPDRPARDTRPHRRLISADRVQGAPVFDREGHKVGHVEDVMLDKLSGHVAYAIMSHGGFLGAAEHYYPIPWTMLHYDIDKAGYVVPLDKAQLESGPALDKVQIDDDSDWTQAVHTHYGMPAPFI